MSCYYHPYHQSSWVLEPIRRICNNQMWKTLENLWRSAKHSHHLEEGQVASANIVEVDLHILPAHLRMVWIDEGKAVCFVVDHFKLKERLGRLVETVIVLSRKQVDPHDTENQPKDEAHQQHIHDGGNGAHQGVDYHLDQRRDRAEASEILPGSSQAYTFTHITFNKCSCAPECPLTILCC